MRLSDLTDNQQVLLGAWFALADAYPPDKYEDLPIECQEAVAELSESTGKYRRSAGRRGALSGRGRIRTSPGVTLPQGARRQVRAAKSRYALATSANGTGLVTT